MIAQDESMGTQSSSGGFMGFVEAHPNVMLLVVGAVVFLVGYSFLKNKTGSITTGTTSASGLTADQSGLATDANGNKIVYVPTTTQFTNTTNYTQNSNDPNLTAITNSPATGQTATTTTVNNNPTTLVHVPPAAIPPQHNTPPPSSTGTVGTPPSTSGTPIVIPHPHNPNPMPPVRSNPPPQPVVVHKGVLVWDTHYQIIRGDTLSGIAAKVNTKLKQQKATATITYHDIYAHNMTVINAQSAAHGNPIHGAATPQQMNNIFPGEVITLPRWT